MASVYHLYADALNVKEHIVTQYFEYAADRKKLYFSAVRIQRRWRGYAARKKIATWNQAAVTLQKFVRGWLVRRVLPELYHNYYVKMCDKYYHLMATRIQALWRGYQVRKVICFKEIRSERNRQQEMSEKLQQSIKDAFEKLRREQEEIERTKNDGSAARVLESIFDRHHLLRTMHIEGVFSIHGSHELSQVEELLKKISYVDYCKKSRRLRNNDEKCVQCRCGASAATLRSFDLNTKIRPEPYERMLLTQD